MNDKVFKGNLFCISTLLLAGDGLFTQANVDMIVKVVQGIAAAVTAYFAIKNYYYAIQEKKERIKQLKEGKKE